MYRLLAQVNQSDIDSIDIPRAEAGDVEIGNAIELAFMVIGIVSVIVIIIAGFQYVLSGGDPQKTKQAKDTILYAIIGLVISVSAWAIVGFVLGSVE